MMYVQLYLHALKMYIARLSHMENAFERLRFLSQFSQFILACPGFLHCPSLSFQLVLLSLANGDNHNRKQQKACIKIPDKSSSSP